MIKMDNDILPSPIDQDSEMFLYQIKTKDGKFWFLKILGTGNKEEFPVLVSHPEVFGWEGVQGMLKLVTKDPIDPKVIVEAIKTDPLETVIIVDGKESQEDITTSFLEEYDK